MENKYFIPDIEDLHIGYECEIHSQYSTKLIKKIGWHPVKVNCFPSMSKYVGILQCKKLIKTHHIRVPYLTKEQIEAEGWTSFVTEYKGDIVPENMTYTFFREDRNYMLGWNFNTNKITLIIKDPSLVENYYNEPTFRGECKDINTFRKIIKLLGI